MKLKITAVLMSLIIVAASTCWIATPALGDSNIGATGLYVTLARGAQWSAANRVWILQPVNPNEALCLSFVNLNPSSSHTFALNVYQSSDPTLTDYSSHTGQWSLAVVNGSASPIAAADEIHVSAMVSGAANIAVSISGASSASGTPDTFNLFAVQGPNCAAPTTWTILSTPAAGSKATVTLPGVPGVRHVAMTMAASLAQTSTAGCVSGPAIYDGPSTQVWAIGMAVAGSVNSQSNVTASQLNIVGTIGNSMGISFAGACTGVFEVVNLTGFDTD